MDEKFEKFKLLLETTGFPVAYNHFPQEEPPAAPYICWLTSEASSLRADGILYYSVADATVELYTKIKDPNAEAKVESTLAPFAYAKTCDYLEDEHIYLTSYSLQL